MPEDTNLISAESIEMIASTPWDIASMQSFAKVLSAYRKSLKESKCWKKDETFELAFEYQRMVLTKQLYPDIPPIEGY